MYYELETKVGCRTAGSTVTYPVVFIILKMCMKIEEHYSDLVNQFFCRRGKIFTVEKDGITLNFGHFQLEIIGMKNHLKQFRNNMFTMRYFCLLGKMSKPADIGQTDE
jgi:hypothetical protein